MDRFIKIRKMNYYSTCTIEGLKWKWKLVGRSL